MKRTGLVIGRQARQYRLKDDEVIVMFKKGSGGEVVAVYESVMDIVDAEAMFNNSFTSKNVYRCLNGNRACFHSMKFQCKVRPVIKKREEVKHYI